MLTVGTLRTALLSLCLAVPLAPMAAADVLVVDASGGGDFTTLQAAVNAAADGDTLLVRSGSYAGFALTGKGLAIVAERGAQPLVSAAVRIAGLPAGKAVVLSGLTVTASYTTDLTKVHALVVDNCAGSVRVQACVLTGANNANDNQVKFGDGTGGSGALVSSSTDVVLTRCTLVGGRGHQQYDCCDFGGTGGAGLHTMASNVALHDCDLRGGAGGYSGWGGPGGPGAFASSLGLFASGCSFTGGEGGDGDDFIWGPGGTGGAGMKGGATAQLLLRDNTYTGGKGGQSLIVGPNGQTGPGIDASAGGTLVQFPGSARRFTIPEVGWEGSRVQLTVQGEPGDQVWFPASPKGAFKFVGPLTGVWALALPVKLLAAPQGVVPSSGVLELAVPITGLSGEGDVRHFQGFVIASGGQGYTGTPTAFVRLACTFSPDCDQSGVPDACEIQSGAVSDCDHNGIPDSCDLAAGTLPDCNLNGTADACDIQGGSSADCDQDGVPDECQYDCNGNGTADVCDVLSGFSDDCDANLVPDECDVDCNANGLPDSCDIALGSSSDANRNGVPDECQSANDVYLVDDDGPPYGADGSPAEPFDTLAKAMAYALDGNTILVADGTYSGPENRALSFGGRDLAIVSQNGPGAVLIDCGGLERAFTFDAGTSLAARLEGLTIRNGLATDAQPEPGYGGGVLVRAGGAATLVDCVIEQCSAKFGGGVHVNSQSDARLEGCALTQNTAVSGTANVGGGGLSSVGAASTGDLVLIDCTVSGNLAGRGLGLCLGSGTNVVQSCEVRQNLYSGFGAAAGIWHEGTGDLLVERSTIAGNVGMNNAAGIHSVGTSDVLISHCVVSENDGGHNGGISVVNPFSSTMSAVIENCLITRNDGAWGGGIHALNVASLTVRGCTFAYNSAAEGAAAHVASMSSATFRNCVVWANTGEGGSATLHANGTSLNVDSCDVQGGLASTGTSVGGSFVWGAGNIDANPQFVDPDGPDGSIGTWADNDFRLGALSPCADAGNDSAVGPDVLDLDGDLDVLEPVPLDLDLLPRFEDDPAVPDTGTGAAPIVDIGAYERP